MRLLTYLLGAVALFFAGSWLIGNFGTVLSFIFWGAVIVAVASALILLARYGYDQGWIGFDIREPAKKIGIPDQPETSTAFQNPEEIRLEVRECWRGEEFLSELKQYVYGTRLLPELTNKISMFLDTPSPTGAFTAIMAGGSVGKTELARRITKALFDQFGVEAITHKGQVPAFGWNAWVRGLKDYGLNILIVDELKADDLSPEFDAVMHTVQTEKRFQNTFVFLFFNDADLPNSKYKRIVARASLAQVISFKPNQLPYIFERMLFRIAKENYEFDLSIVEYEREELLKLFAVYLQTQGVDDVSATHSMENMASNIVSYLYNENDVKSEGRYILKMPPSIPDFVDFDELKGWDVVALKEASTNGH